MSHQKRGLISGFCVNTCTLTVTGSKPCVLQRAKITRCLNPKRMKLLPFLYVMCKSLRSLNVWSTDFDKFGVLYS